LLAEYDHNGNCVRDYIYAGNRLIAEYKPQTDEYFYYMTDQINSTRIITNDSGNVVFSEACGPYGDVQKTWTNIYDPKLKFSGKEREGYSGLDYFGARYYDHKSFRFNSVDPIINREEALYNPQLWNLYAYCGNNPITYFDPYGMLYGRFGYVTHPVKSGIQIPNNPRGFPGATRPNLSASCTPVYDNGVIRPEFNLELFVHVWFTAGQKNHEMRHLRDMYYAFSKLMIIAKYIEENVSFTNMDDFNEFVARQVEIFKSYMEEQVKKSKTLRDSAFLGWIDIFQSFIPLSGINNGSDVPENREWNENDRK
jgi:RHS repeat-associated protein